MPRSRCRCIAGGYFDNEYDAIYEPDRVADLLSLAGLKSRYGTYARYGNHGSDEKIPAALRLVTESASPTAGSVSF